MNTAIILAAQENSAVPVDFSLFLESIISGFFYLICFALFGYALYILLKSSYVLLLEKPQKPEEKSETISCYIPQDTKNEWDKKKKVEYQKQLETYEKQLKLHIEHNKIYSVLALLIFSVCFLVLELADLLSGLINVRLIIFSALVFINIIIAFADNIFEIAKKNRRVIITLSALAISGQYLITIVINEERLIIVRLLVAFTLVALNVINIYGLTKKSTSN